MIELDHGQTASKTECNPLCYKLSLLPAIALTIMKIAILQNRSSIAARRASAARCFQPEFFMN